MPDNHLFEYAVIRVVPQVEREEFLNVGVIMYCAGLKFLGMRYQVNEHRLSAFSSQIDIPEITAYLQAFEQVCRGGADGGPIGKLPMPERFRWLTATRSTVVQTSKLHPGLCTDAAETLRGLFQQFVEDRSTP